MWVEVLREAWSNPFSRLRRKQFELALIKDLIVQDQLTCKLISKQRKTQPLGNVTITMPTEGEAK